MTGSRGRSDRSTPSELDWGDKEARTLELSMRGIWGPTRVWCGHVTLLLTQSLRAESPATDTYTSTTHR